jgi:dolichol-phosphate mannosyltransferase
MSNNILVVIPTYNEANNLPAISAELLTLDVEDLGILVVDDASPDGTGEVAEELVKRYPGRFHVIHRQGKLGLGTAYIQGFTWAQGCTVLKTLKSKVSYGKIKG